MTQAVAQVRHVVDRTGFTNPLTLNVVVTDVDYLEVYADDELLTQGSEYTVDGIGSPFGVEITIIGADDPDNYLGYESFTALFTPPLDQLASLSSGGGLGRPYELALDQQNRRMQSLGDRTLRALKVPVNVEGDIVVPRVPAAAIVWNDDGDGFLALPIVVGEDGIAALQGEPGEGVTPASASAPAYLDFREDTDNGVNRGRLTVPAALTADRTYILPDADMTFSAFMAGLMSSASAAALQIAAGIREMLTANCTYYVRTDGSDSNTGLVDSADGAFLTIQKALNVVYGTLDLGGHDVTIDIGNGTYTAALTVSSPQVGAGNITLHGDTTTPSNVHLSVAGQVITVTGFGSKLRVQGVKISSSAGFGALSADAGGFITISGKVEFGTCTGHHVIATANGVVFNTGIEEIISGNAPSHYYSGSSGYIQSLFSTWTLSGTPAFATAFAVGRSAGIILVAATTTAGAATGSRYSSTQNSVINASGGGASVFPGNAAGSTATGGIYA